MLCPSHPPHSMRDGSWWSFSWGMMMGHALGQSGVFACTSNSNSLPHFDNALILGAQSTVHVGGTMGVHVVF